jgi:hypothetical protein
MKRNLLICSLIFIFSQGTYSQQSSFLLNSNWKARKAVDVLIDGTVITGKDFNPQGWIDAVVPGTVLTTLLHNKLIPILFRHEQ